VSTSSPVRYESRCVHVDGEMTIYTCGELKRRMLEELAAHPDAISLDLSRVVELDTAGLQLLLTARRYANDAGRELRVANPSRVVADVLELCRLSDLLATPAAAAGEAP
jgi:anti-sigma B factor antagonist